MKSKFIESNARLGTVAAAPHQLLSLIERPKKALVDKWTTLQLLAEYLTSIAAMRAS
jgi:hypothetical protein